MRLTGALAALCVGVAALLIGACATTGEPGADPLRGRLIVVAGGSGRAGAYVLRELQTQGLRFRATTRSLAEARTRLGAAATGVDWIEADLRDPVQAATAVAGADMVISVIGSREISGANSAEFVDYGAVRNLVDAAARQHVARFVLLTAIGSTDPDSFGNKVFRGALQWRFRGEEHLRSSGVAYTVVRPAGLVNEPGGAKGVALYQGDDWRSHLRKTISRADLAAVLVECLRSPGARNASFEVANDPDVGPGAWRGRMLELRPD